MPVSFCHEHGRVQRPATLRGGRRGAAAAEVCGLIMDLSQRLALVVGLSAALIPVSVGAQALQRVVRDGTTPYQIPHGFNRFTRVAAARALMQVLEERRTMRTQVLNDPVFALPGSAAFFNYGCGLPCIDDRPQQRQLLREVQADATVTLTSGSKPAHVTSPAAMSVSRSAGL